MSAQEAIDKLKTIQAGDDPETDHADADEVLCELLKDHGFDAVVLEYKKVFKWYA